MQEISQDFLQSLLTHFSQLWAPKQEIPLSQTNKQTLTVSSALFSWDFVFAVVSGIVLFGFSDMTVELGTEGSKLLLLLVKNKSDKNNQKKEITYTLMFFTVGINPFRLQSL